MKLTTQHNIIQNGMPSKTALQVAALRASHQLLDEPIIFNDPVALPILGQKAEADIRHDPFQLNDLISRSIRAGLVVRSRLAEDLLEQLVQSGVKQYVVLGAGLDTFAFRNTHLNKELHVFEVDHPSTQDWKRAVLKEARIQIPDSMTFVAIDFENNTLAEGLQSAGFRADQPAYFSWLGVTMYLSWEAIFETLKFVASMPKGSGIVFDYGVLPSLLNPIDNAIADYIGNLITELGEPWKTSFDPIVIQKELQSIGFHSIEDLGPFELNARYLPSRKDGLQTGGVFRLIYAAI